MHLNFLNVNASGSASVAVANGNATLWSVNVNTGAASGVCKVYNAGSAVAADLVATIDCTNPGSYWYGARCPKGIFYAISGGAPDVTFGWQ